MLRRLLDSEGTDRAVRDRIRRCEEAYALIDRLDGNGVDRPASPPPPHAREDDGGGRRELHWLCPILVDGDDPSDVS